MNEEEIEIIILEFDFYLIEKVRELRITSALLINAAIIAGTGFT